jgi:hypothetical protein
MGAWGAGIFDDDLAIDVRAAFEREIESGKDVKNATDTVLKSFVSALRDSDDRPVVYLALAALQTEHGELRPDIRAKALQAIETGEALEKWNEDLTDWPGLTERKKVLEEMRTQLYRGSA